MAQKGGEVGMVVKEEDVIAYFIDDDLVCRDWVSKEERKCVTADRILLRHCLECSDDVYFCDRCEEQLHV